MEEIQLHVDPMCLMSPSEQTYEGKKKLNTEPYPPPKVFVITMPLCVFVGV